MNFTNFNKVRESYDKTYLSIIANNREEIALVDTQFTPPEWFPSPNLQTRWMYGGGRGAGVLVHVDDVGCKCSWGYMLFGRKKWWLETPPGMGQGKSYEVVQASGDFIFWCVGYLHSTLVSEQSEPCERREYEPLLNQKNYVMRPRFARSRF